MGAMASQITSLTTVCSTFYSGADQRKHQDSASLAWPVNSPHKGPVTWKMFRFDDVTIKMMQGNILPDRILKSFFIGANSKHETHD